MVARRLGGMSDVNFGVPGGGCVNPHPTGMKPCEQCSVPFSSHVANLSDPHICPVCFVNAAIARGRGEPELDWEVRFLGDSA